MCEIAEWIVFIWLGVCGIFDWKQKEVPLSLLLIMSATVLVLAICCPSETAWSRVGGAMIGILFFIISKCTKEAIGYGDSWLILILGIHLGGVRALQLLFAASLAAGICSLFYLWKKHWKRNATLPFVPFLAVAYLGVMFI